MVFIQTGDHKIPVHKFWLSITGNIEKEVTKKGGPDLATKRGFLGKFSLELEWWYRYSESRSPYNEEERDPISRHSVNSLGTLVLGRWSWDISLGSLVLGHWSWDISLGPLVLGH